MTSTPPKNGYQRQTQGGAGYPAGPPQFPYGFAQGSNSAPLPNQPQPNQPQPNRGMQPTQFQGNQQQPAPAWPPQGQFGGYGAETGVVQNQTQASSQPAPQSGAHVEGFDVEGHTLLRFLARGGMGEVYLARQHHTDALRVVKTLRPEYLDEENLERFKIEARALAAVQHPGLVNIITLDSNAEVPYLVMEYVESPDLLRALEQEWSPRRAMKFMAKLLRVLNEVHECGIVHRDLKPANIFVCEGDEPKITDFGLARVGEGQGLTLAGDIMGTPAYMSPEQASGKIHTVDHRSDIWACGVMLLQLLTGELPFVAQNGNAIIIALQLGTYRSVHEFSTELEPDLLRVLCRALEHRSERRYQSCSEFADDLQSILDGNSPTHALRRARELQQKWILRTLIGLTTILLICLPIVYFWSQFEQRERARQKANHFIKQWQSNIAAFDQTLQSAILENDSAKRTELINKANSIVLELDNEQKKLPELSFQPALDLETNQLKVKVAQLTLNHVVNDKMTANQRIRMLTLSLLRSESTDKTAQEKQNKINPDWAWQTLTKESLKKELIKPLFYCLAKTTPKTERIQTTPWATGLAFGLGLFANSPRQNDRERNTNLNLLLQQQHDPASASINSLDQRQLNQFFAAFEIGLKTSEKTASAVIPAYMKILRNKEKPTNFKTEQRLPKLCIFVEEMGRELDADLAEIKLQTTQLFSASQSMARRYAEERDYVFKFWNPLSLQSFEKYTVEALKTAELLLSISQSRGSEATILNSKLKAQLTPFYEDGFFVILRWSSRPLYRRCLRLGTRVVKMIHRGQEDLQWRLSQDTIFDPDSSDDAIRDALKQLESIRQAFLRPETERTLNPDLQDLNNLHKTTKAKASDKTRYAYFAPKFVEKLNLALVQGHLRLNRPSRALAIVKSWNQLVRRGQIGKFKLRDAQRCYLEYLRYQAEHGLELNDVVRLYEKEPPLPWRQWNDQRLVNGFDDYIQVLKQQKLGLEAKLSKKALDQRLTRSYVHDRSIAEKFEFLDAWIRDVLALANIFEFHGQSRTAEKLRQSVTNYADELKHPIFRSK